MADIDSQRLQQELEETQRKLAGLNKNIDPLAKANAKGATKAEALANAAGTAAKELGGLTGQIMRGQQASQIYAKSINNLVDAAGNLVGAFGKGKVGAILGGLAASVGGAANAVELVANMSDRLFVSFQDLSRAGAAGAEGMSGVFDQMQNFRLGLEDLGQLTQLFGQNAQSLVLFGGTVEDGAKSLGTLRKFVTGSGLEREFMALGMNTQEINESMAGFVAVQSRMGMTQVTDYAKVAASLNAYIAEQDKITKLTGVTRKQQEQNTMRAMATEQFRAKIERLKAQGDYAEAERQQRMQRLFYGVSQQLGDQYTAVASGFVTAGAGVAGQLTTQGTLLQAANDRRVDEIKAAEMVGEGLRRFNEGVGQAAASAGVYQKATNANYAQALDDAAMLQRIAKGYTTVEERQAAQRGAPDAGTKAQIELRTVTMDTMKNLQLLANEAVPFVTNQLGNLAEGARAATIPLLEIAGLGAKAAGGTSGYGQGGTGTQEGSVAATGGGAAAAAAAASRLPIPHPLVKGAVVGGAAAFGGLGGYGAYQGMGGQEIDPDKVIKFDPSGSGSRAHFDKLRPDVRKNALAMAYAYQKATGERLSLKSAFRSVEEQAALKSQGGPFPIAEPGSSLHQQGRALDFTPFEVDRLESMGLLQKFGFNRLRGDPPHIYMQDGGIAMGPKSGYQATLHGTEAVVPLPDGKAIPVEMPGMSNQMNMMGDQISRLDELIALMRNQNGISHRILQAATN